MSGTTPGISAPSSGLRLADALAIITALNQLQMGRCSNGLTATAAGTQANSLVLGNPINEIVTVGSAGDGVKLPAAAAPSFVFVEVNNNNSITVFANGTDTINGTAGSTGVSQAGNKAAVYFCPVVGKWYRILSA